MFDFMRIVFVNALKSVNSFVSIVAISFIWKTKIWLVWYNPDRDLNYA